MKISEKWFKRKWVSYTIATCSAVILFMILSNLDGIFSGFSSLYGFIRPIVTGIVIAYVFNPVAKLFESKVFKKVKKESTKWAISVAFTIIVIVLAVVLLFVALIPQLVDSVATFLSNVGGYVDALQELLREFENNTPSHIFGVDLSAIANFGEKILGTIGTGLLQRKCAYDR